jgi:hypothetical protein
MKTLTTLACTIVLLSALADDAHAWGSITHAYLAHQLGAETGLANAQEIYGSTLPDMFNLMDGSPYKDYLWTETHYNFMKVANRCRGRYLDAFAFGYASHNDAWGADLTAHHDARTGPGTGYVIAKVNELVPVLRPLLVDVLIAAGVPDAEDIADAAAPGLAENFVETAVDLLVRENEDPVIGYRLAIAAQLRDYRIPYRMFGAYAGDFAREFRIGIIDAATILLQEEHAYRELMRAYGLIFTRDISESAPQLARMGANLAADFLKAETGMDISIPPQILEDFLFDEVLPIIEPDYDDEIAATLTYLAGEIEAHGFGASTALAPSNDGDMPDMLGFQLHQNVPNPFNPATTIVYTLPTGAQVLLAVYDVMGREIAVLVNEHRPGGTHEITWNAAGLPSGVYFCRITAGPFIATRKMCLLR